jgi:hypothetical protein
MKTPILKLLLISFLLLIVPTGCASRKAITEEFVDYLIQTNSGTLDRVESDLQIIDRNLYVTDEKLLELEQVIAPALEWIENQKIEIVKEHRYGSWHSRVTPESLAEFKNDQYEISALEFYARGIGTPNQKFDTVIKVIDLDTKMQSDWDTVEGELNWRKSTLENSRRAKLNEGQLSSSTLNNVIECLGDWDIHKTGSTTYNIGGPGLGMAGGLTTGNWIYDRVSKEIIPADTQSLALQSVLSRGF